MKINVSRIANLPEDERRVRFSLSDATSRIRANVGLENEYKDMLANRISAEMKPQEAIDLGRLLIASGTTAAMPSDFEGELEFTMKIPLKPTHV